MGIPNALSIAGLDPSGGAGILAEVKAMSALGWRPGIPFEERVPELVEWYRAHRAWWQHIMDTPHYQLHHVKLRRGGW